MPTSTDSDQLPSIGIALVGNPGTGKSTILNGLVGKPIFSSGLSFGTGRTKNLQEHVIDKASYFDTPGLDDISRRRESGEELDRLLKADVSLKIIFVITLVNGRARPEDRTTMSLMLDAIKSAETKDRFGVIVNMVPPGFEEAMKADQSLEQTFRASITGDYSTTRWIYVPRTDELQDLENGQLLTPELTRFFATIPETRPRGAEVAKIDTKTFDERLEKEMTRFEEREKALSAELGEARAEANRQLTQISNITSELERMRVQGREMELENQKRIREMERRMRETERLLQEAKGDADELRRNMSRGKKAKGDTIYLHEWIRPGEGVVSKNRRFVLWHEVDGDLKMYDFGAGKRVIWSSDTGGRRTTELKMVKETGLMLRDGGRRVWSPDEGRGSGYAVMQNDGNFCTYSETGGCTWSSGSWQHGWSRSPCKTGYRA